MTENNESEDAKIMASVYIARPDIDSNSRFSGLQNEMQTS